MKSDLYDIHCYNFEIPMIEIVVTTLEEVFGEPFSKVIVINHKYIEVCFNKSWFTNPEKYKKIYDLFFKANNILFDEKNIKMTSITPVQGYLGNFTIDFDSTTL